MPAVRPVNVKRLPMMDAKSPSWLLNATQIKQPVNAVRPLIDRIQKINFLRFTLSFAVRHVAAFASSRIAKSRELLSGGTDTGVNSRRFWFWISICR